MIKNSPKNTNLNLSLLFWKMDLATFVMTGFNFSLMNARYTILIFAIVIFYSHFLFPVWQVTN